MQSTYFTPNLTESLCVCVLFDVAPNLRCMISNESQCTLGHKHCLTCDIWAAIIAEFHILFCFVSVCSRMTLFFCGGDNSTTTIMPFSDLAEISTARKHRFWYRWFSLRSLRLRVGNIWNEFLTFRFLCNVSFHHFVIALFYDCWHRVHYALQQVLITSNFSYQLLKYINFAGNFLRCHKLQRYRFCGRCSWRCSKVTPFCCMWIVV